MGKEKNSILLKGLGVSGGIVIAKAYLIERGKIEPAGYCHIDSRATENEIDRFTAALQESHDQISRIKTKLETDGHGKDHIAIIDSHLMIFQDQMLIDDTIKVIREEKINAEWALKKVLKTLTDIFDSMDDEYLKERSSDIEHSVNRILVNLMGSKHVNLADIEEPSVVVAHDLDPSDTAQMARSNVLAFLTDVGGRTSHTAIIARSLEIPAVVGLESVTHQVEPGDTVIIDGTTGTVIINPSDNVIAVYEKRKERFEEFGRTLFDYKDLPCETTDGEHVELLGNIEMVEELDSLLEHGAEGIGLYRSEFLYMNKSVLPTEEEHVEAYRKVAAKMSGKPVIIRTLDIGGDKPLKHLNMEEEANPAMGLRAIRLCFQWPDLFKTQLRGILRASAFGKVKVMFPMISGVQELRRSKAVFEEAKAELREEGIDFDEEMEVGIMIEIPSAAAIADLLAAESDFFSIGTNDLLQYTLAVDRVNEHVAYLYEPSHPAVLRIIRQVAEAANEAGISVGVCGEMAGEPIYALLFLGLGITHLSMGSSSILRVKKLIRSVSAADARDICDELFKLKTAPEIESYLTLRMKDLYDEEF